MTLIQELDLLNRAIKDNDIRLYSIKAGIDQLDKEIAVLTPRKKELEQNLEFLKKQETIPLAQEFKKTKAELSKTVSRLNTITADRAKAHQAALTAEQIIAKFKRDHANLVISSENNILKGNFGGRRGKK